MNPLTRFALRRRPAPSQVQAKVCRHQSHQSSFGGGVVTSSSLSSRSPPTPPPHRINIRTVSGLVTSHHWGYARTEDEDNSQLNFMKAGAKLHRQQVRFRRHDRSSAFSKPRPPTRKQRKEYNRKMKKLREKQERIGAPGSKAGPHREWLRERRQELLSYEPPSNALLDPNSSQENDYEIGDALLDDLMGNTAHLTSTPTPEPEYLGDRHEDLYNKLSDQMNRYRISVEALRGDQESAIFDPTRAAGLPNDSDIANVLRAYRDKHGTRSKPIGIAKALEHLLKDIGVPTLAFGELTYNAILTCCRTPKEVSMYIYLYKRLIICLFFITLLSLTFSCL